MIKLCYYNKFTNEIADFLKANSVDFTIDKCLNKCNVCHMKPIAKVNDYLISADNTEKLIMKIKEYMAFVK